jgi:hypothetical protein
MIVEVDEEHTRLRRQFNAFFTPENVDNVYTTLRDAAVRTVQEISRAQQTSSGTIGGHSVASGKEAGDENQMEEGVAVDGWAMTHDLINQVVMKACTPTLSRLWHGRRPLSSATARGG